MQDQDITQESKGSLSPEMASLRLLVLDFVRDYIGRWGQSPSYGEIANGVDTHREGARRAVKSLAADGLLLRNPGPRGLSLPSQREQALRLLRDQGYVIDEDIGQVQPPPSARSGAAVADTPLLPPAALDYLPIDSAAEGSDDGEGKEGGEERGGREAA